MKSFVKKGIDTSGKWKCNLHSQEENLVLLGKYGTEILDYLSTGIVQGKL